MSLWLCLRFDALPLEALLQQPEPQGNRATVVVAQRLVVACDDTARCAGVIPGQGALLRKHYSHSTTLLLWSADPSKKMLCYNT